MSSSIVLRVVTSRSRFDVAAGDYEEESVVLLDEVCWKCKGPDHYADVKTCDECNGVGYVTTDAGDALLAFLDRHRP